MAAEHDAYRSRSLWLEQVDGPLTPRPALPGDAECDVAIVGGGFTGLWTAYSLARAEPGLRIVLVEAEICGFGASGRNGGWASALFAGSAQATAATRGPEGVRAMHTAHVGAITDIADTCAREGIDCDFRRGGTLTLATSPAHVARLRETVDREERYGIDPDVEWLDADAVQKRVGAASALGAAYTPHCAAIQPARLARGLADAAERRDVSIYEQTRATALEPGRVVTDRGMVRAPTVVRATEAYTPRLRGFRRRIVPLYSFLIATEPLPRSFWDEIGWSAGETVGDARHLFSYAQRTADDRIAFGGRGAPYHWNSLVRREFDRAPGVFHELERVLHEWFPQLRDTRVTHTWGGALGIARDWYPSVGLDPSTRLAWAGGYVGDGVTTTNLAGRTLSDLILGRSTERTELAWVNHESPEWEPEPFRWLGINAGLRLAAAADRREARTGRRATGYERALHRFLG